MRKLLIGGALLILPGGMILMLFHLMRHERKNLLEILSAIKEKIQLKLL